MCALSRKGLVERRLAASADETVRYGKAYIYTPLVGDAAELQHANAVPEPTVAAWEARARQAELQMQALERRAKAAERRAEKAERRLEALQKQLNRPPRPKPTPRPPREIIIEHCDEVGICRVCAAPAPRSYKPRTDGLRVCVVDGCRQEARRRDNVAKQRRYNARRA